MSHILAMKQRPEDDVLRWAARVLLEAEKARLEPRYADGMVLSIVTEGHREPFRTRMGTACPRLVDEVFDLASIPLPREALLRLH